MLVNNCDSVSDGFQRGLHWLRVGGITQDTRNGPVIVSPTPVLTVYKRPLNRVLFSPVRDANPFFHVMESLWMLAGRNDLPWLTQFNARFASYSDDGGLTQPGAYGYRWRNYFGYDQLETLVVELRNNPQTRRAVLAMWVGGQENVIASTRDASADLLSAIAGSADVPCNTHTYFDTIDGRLNMTVCCRSNDVVWGCYGANAVHFSFLLEYVAAGVGLPMGVYRQFSNNFHLYESIVPREGIMPYARDVESSDKYAAPHYGNFKPVAPDLRRVPLVGNYDRFLPDLQAWFDNPSAGGLDTPFLTFVAVPMFEAWQLHKAKDYPAAIEAAELIKAEDWKIACVEWLQRRQARAAQREAS